MLSDSLRKKLTGLSKLSLVVAMLVWGGAAVAQDSEKPKGQVLDKIIAKVDDYITLKSSLDLAVIEAGSRQQFGSVPDRCEVLRSLIQSKLMLAKAEIDSITVSDEEVSNNLDRRIQMMVSQLGSVEEIEAYYNKPLSQFKAELKKRMREQLIVGRMQESITADVSVTPAEVRAFFNRIPKDSLPPFSTEVTVGHIVKLPVVSPMQKTEVRNKLNEIRAKIVNGEATFAEMAREYSEDPGSAAAGGDLGFWRRGELAPEFEATALKLKPGDISAPVETEFGFHIIQLIERRGNTYNSRHILMKPASSEDDIKRAENYLDSLRTQIVDNKIDFAKAANEYSEDKMTNSAGGFFTDPSGSTRISVEDIDPSLYFMIDSMQVGSISKPQPYRTEDGKTAVRIVYYKSKVPPHIANLRDDYQKIQTAALNEKKNKQIEKWFNEAVREVYINIDPEYDYCGITSN